ncbi:hypothetical protein GCM10027321_19760 [Massilia terrae]|uniref:Addiction module antidote protein n=1 Tax=Massilia terrae TaxID=1811224 RepID=A0ABT2CVL5_9BURK|nr:hypothetical protein [Massilia terrae]MCS0658018.1 hypothetical protein [Massilia terrae]
MADPTPPLDTLEAIASYLADAFESGEADLIRAAFSAVANAPAAAELAAAAGFPRAALHDALLAGELPLDLTLAIMKVIDLYR